MFILPLLNGLAFMVSIYWLYKLIPYLVAGLALFVLYKAIDCWRGRP